jgi:glycogen(starch) synthase
MVSWEYPPHIVTGVSTHVRGLARALAAAGHDVVVFTSSSTDAPHAFDDDGVRVRRATVDLPFVDDADVVASMASANHHFVSLLGELGEWRPDVVHGHDWTSGWAAHTIARLTHTPLVMTLHGTEHSRHGGHVPDGVPASVHAIENWLAWAADLIVTNSRFMLNGVLDAFEIDPSRARLIPNGIDAESWAAPGDTAREPLVMAWGRVLYEKGFQVVAQALGRLRGRIPHLTGVIAGRGPYLAELQSQIDVEGVHDLVHLAGFVPDAELRATLHRAGCVVIPSLYEPFGVVALEALASGAPVIAADTGGLHEILADTGAALLFEPGNDAQLADTIERVLTDPQLAAGLTNTASNLVRDTYSWSAVATRTVDTYRHVITGG